MNLLEVAPEFRPPKSERIFRTFFMGGFECSTHKLRSGKRLDMVAATKHDAFCDQDYLRLRQQGVQVVREGIRWHLIEKRAWNYDFSSVLPIVRAAQKHRMQVLWDICHYGWPDGIDIFRPEFVRRYKHLAFKFAQWLSQETLGPLFFAPINEISFLAWAGGEDPHLNPYCTGRGFELKCQLVRAAIEGMEAIWSILPTSRFLQIDPVIHIVADSLRTAETAEAEGYRMAQYQACDLLSGRLWPQLGGQEKYLDIIGLNFYPNNEWIYKGSGLHRSDPLYRPLSKLLHEWHTRFGRPMFIAETGAEDFDRPDWLQYVTSEVLSAQAQGVSLHGICLYPIVNHPGWCDERHCQNGLWDYSNEHGDRPIYSPLQRELENSQALVAETEHSLA